MKLSIVPMVGLVLSVVAIFLSAEMTRAHNPSCPADWPDIDVNGPVINELHHTDGHGDELGGIRQPARGARLPG